MLLLQEMLMLKQFPSIPYAIRFRQCLSDYAQPTTTSRKQLYNALKYATSFPVIFLSAAQREISSEPSDTRERHPLFRLWYVSLNRND